MQHRRYLTIEQRENLQRLLVARAAELRVEIGEDRLENLNAEPVAISFERDILELLGIEAALNRLHEPDFGLCADCGADIPYARLEARLGATRCDACQASAKRQQSGARA